MRRRARIRLKRNVAIKNVRLDTHYNWNGVDQGFQPLCFSLFWSPPSTAPRFRRLCSRPSSSATRRARSPARIEQHRRDLGQEDVTLSPAAVDALKAYPWPGNVRELQNWPERAAILSDGDALHPQQFNLEVDDRPCRSIRWRRSTADVGSPLTCAGVRDRARSAITRARCRLLSAPL
jgi:hypothetical protein